MGVKQEASSVPTPEEYLRLALAAESPRARARYAELGLAAEPDETETRALLLRQLYLALFGSEQLEAAAEVALTMVALGALPEVTHHDASRAFAALGDLPRAVAHQRLAVRAAPGSRRSFHYWALGSLLHIMGDTKGAEAAFRRGERWAGDDRPLLRAHRAWVRLSAGEAVRNLQAVFHDLATSRAREGYGQYLLGMLAVAMGDDRRAAVHLRAFLRRNASAEPIKALALREELTRARRALARIESD